MEVGQVTNFTMKEYFSGLYGLSGTADDSDYVFYDPIGCIELVDNFLSDKNTPQYILCFIYYEEFIENFCTLSEYRKLKLEKINESR